MNEIERLELKLLTEKFIKKDRDFDKEKNDAVTLQEYDAIHDEYTNVRSTLRFIQAYIVYKHIRGYRRLGRR